LMRRYGVGRAAPSKLTPNGKLADRLWSSRLAVISEVAMDLRSARGRRKMVGCARDDAGRPMVQVSPF